MGIAIQGIIDPSWARSLDRFSGRDGVVNVWINRNGDFGALPLSRTEQRFIGLTLRQLDRITGLRFQRTQRRASDLDISAVEDLGGNLIGLTTRRRGWFEVAWEGRRGGQLTRSERRTIKHEIGHALGLDHPFGSGFNPRYNTNDTLMSYNIRRNANYTSSDVAALKFLWGG